MKTFQYILFLGFFSIGACSSDNQAPAAKTPNAKVTTIESAPSGQIGSENPFSAQINAIGAAKDVSAAANKTIDQHQQELDNSNR